MTAGSERVDVAIIGPSHLDSFASNIAEGFDELGIHAEVIDPFARFAGKGTLRAYNKYGTMMREVIKQWDIARTNLLDRPIAEALGRLDPRLVLSIYGYFDPGQVESWRCRTPRADWVLWYPDHFSNLGPHRTLLAPYDHFFFKDPYIVDRFARRTGLPAHYLADACNPRHHRPPAFGEGESEPSCDVVMVGNLYAFRLLVLEGLSANVDLRIYGNQRTRLAARFSRLAHAHTGQAVFGLDKARVFAEARIVLNTMHYGEVAGVNTRLFEATGSGGFVLTHPTEGLHRYFEPGKELVVFETPAEMNSLVARYLDDPDARRAIATAGAARTHRDHTYPVRLVDLIGACGLVEEAPFDCQLATKRGRSDLRRRGDG